MFGLEFAAVGLLHLVSNDLVPSIQCSPKIPPKIKVLSSKSHVEYDFTKEKNDLDRFEIDTVSPYDHAHDIAVGGVTSGSINDSREILFLRDLHPEWEMGCVHIKEVNVTVHFDPTIYIASEYKKGSCEHREILKHEKKHIRADQVVINQYINDLEAGLNALLVNRGYSFGPYRMSELDVVQKNVQAAYEQIIAQSKEKMRLHREKAHQAIDTKEEYDSIAAMCQVSQ